MVAEMVAENLKVGARGWRHRHWSGSYYPDDLPEAWQLSYYANEFRVVLVPMRYWHNSSGYDVERWLEAVDEDFCFYLECPVFENVEKRALFVRQCALFGTQLGAVIVDDSVKREALIPGCTVLSYPETGRSNIENKVVDVGFLEHDIENLREVRLWLETFDKHSASSNKVVFVTNRKDPDITIDALDKIQKLSEMMGL